MNKSKLIEWIDNPAAIDEDATRELREIVHEFPASPILHWLYLKGLQNQKSYLFNSALSRAAIGSPNRAHLMKWVELEPEPLEKKQRFEFVIPKLKEKEETKVEPVKVETPIQVETPKPVVPVEKKEEPVAKVEEKPVKIEPEVQVETVNEEVEPPKPAAVKVEEIKTVQTNEADLPDDVKAILERSRKLRNSYNKVEEEPETKQQEVHEKVESAVAEDVPDEKEISTPAEVIQEVVTEEKPKEDIKEQAVEQPVEEVVEKQEQELTETPKAEESIVFEPQLNEGTESSQEEETEETYFSLDFGPNLVEEEEPQEEEEVFEQSFEIILDDVQLDTEEIVDAGEDEDEEVVSIKEESVELSKEILQVEPEEQTDFANWLKQLKSDKEQEQAAPTPFEINTEVAPEPEKKLDPEKASKIALIDKFLEEKPKIVPRKEQFSLVDLSNEQENEDGQYITETLAQIYVKQGHYNKAIEAYEILGLKYPNKNSFFADRIREIRRIK